MQLTTSMKGMVEASVRYVKQNALAGRAEQLTTWSDYQQLAITWRDEVANLRLHQTTHQRPIDRFQDERTALRALPTLPFDTDEVVSTIATPHARVNFDGNRYSVPADVVRQPVTIRASAEQVRILYQGGEVACHERCYQRGQLIVQAEHRLQALQLRQRVRASHLEETFQALGEAACEFLLKLQARPIKTTYHIRRLLNLVRLYGREEVLAAIALAHQYQTYDAAYVETLLLQERRRKELPSPTPLRPKRQELIDEIDLEEPDPATYDRLIEDDEESEPETDD